MEKAVKYKGEEITLKCVEMSHSSVGGEYEIVFSEEIGLDLDKIRRALENRGYQPEEVKDRSLSLLHKEAVITVLKSGGILLQDLVPDTPAEAMRIAEEIVNAAQT
jgi:hypothetical protein